MWRFAWKCQVDRQEQYTARRSRERCGTTEGGERQKSHLRRIRFTFRLYGLSRRCDPYPEYAAFDKFTNLSAVIEQPTWAFRYRLSVCDERKCKDCALQGCQLSG